LSETTDEEEGSSEEEIVTKSEPRRDSMQQNSAKSEVKLAVGLAKPQTSTKLTESISSGVKLPLLTNKSGGLMPKPDEMKAANRQPVLEPQIIDPNRQEVDQVKKVTKRRRKMKAKKLVLNVSMTKYHVVRYVARTLFKMRLSNASYQQEPDDPKDEWDIFWTDGQVQVEKLYRMKPYQRINHFPGMYALARKDHLARNLHRM
jgi:hypothetical protein